MDEERELIALGWPPDEAFQACQRRRKDGTLAEFMRKQWHDRDPVPKCPLRRCF